MILLDTHVLIWLRQGSRRLGAVARRETEQAWRAGEAAVSAISFWEVALLHERGRMTLSRDIPSWRLQVLQAGLREIPVDGEIGIRAWNLDDFHRDPADRLIVATALGGHRLVTADRRILEWPGPLARIPADE